MKIVIKVLCISICYLLCSVGIGTVVSDQTTFFKTTSSPSPIREGDQHAFLSADNLPDLAVVNCLDRDVSILLNDGSGTFGNRTDYPVTAGNTSWDLASADFNQDGLDDYAVTTYTAFDVEHRVYKISIFLADGQGGFTNVQNTTARPCRPYNILAEDFNNDGYPDLVFIGVYARHFYVSLNKADGTGTFYKRTINEFIPSIYSSLYPSPSGDAYKMVAGDFNNDGNIDLVFTFEKWTWGPHVFLREHYISVVFGDGTGGFGSYNPIPTGLGYFPDVTAADFNNDGNLDLALTNNFERNVGLYLGDGTGNFSTPSTFPIIFDPWQIRSADFNNDGNSDLLVSTFDNSYFEILLGDGTGYFIDHTRFYGIGRDIVVDDLNGDGIVDIATTTDDGYPAYGQLNILFGKGNAEFEDPVFYQVGVIPDGIVTGEFGSPGALSGDVGSCISESSENPNTHHDLSFRREEVDWYYTDTGEDFQFTPLVWLDSNAGIDRSCFSSFQDLELSINPEVSQNSDTCFQDCDLKASESIDRLFGCGERGTLSVGGVSGEEEQALDLVFSNLFGDDLSTIDGNAQRGFQNRDHVAVGDWPSKGCQGDFNGDGHADLAVVNTFDRTVSILLGDGTGDFMRFQDISIGFVGTRYICGEIITQDLNNDGVLDLAVANLEDGDITLLFGDGTGYFSNRMDLPAGNYAMGLISDDFNNDGFYDLAVCNYRDDARDLMVYLNNGTNFGFTITEYNCTNGWMDLHFRDIIADDFNDDGFVDLALLYYGIDLVFVYCGDGSGRFDSEPVRSKAAPRWNFVRQMTSADFNNDGILDIAISAPRGSYGKNDVVSILLGDGTGKFPSENMRTITPDFYHICDIVAADFNNDSNMDVIVTNREWNGGTKVFYGDGDGNFSKQIYVGAGNKPAGIISGDFNDDGATDVVVTNNKDDDISIILNDGSGGFVNEQRYRQFDEQFTFVSIEDIAKGDFNHDGFLDLVVATMYPNALTILFGNGHGGYPYNISYEFCCGQVPTDLLVYDFDGDGSLDVAAADIYHDVMYLFWNNGSGGFSLESRRLSLGRHPLDSILGDFNGDGEQDIAVANWGSNDISVLLGDGSGWFFSQVRFQTEELPDGIVSGDFNQDTYLDLAVSSYGKDRVSVFYGDGTGDFSDRVDYSVGWYPMSLTAEDVNSDGCLDLIVPIRGRQNRGITILYGTMNGDFTHSLSYTVSQELCYIKTADFNQDGYIDLAGTDRDDHNIHILYGDGTGMFPTQSVQPGGWHPWNLLIGEYTGTLPTQPIISGPASPEAGTTQSYQIASQDNEEDPLFYQIDWGDGTVSDWLGPFSSGQQITVYHTWDVTKKAVIRVTAKDIHDIKSIPGVYMVAIESGVPSNPVIDGPEQVASEEQTRFTVTATDPDEDQLFYRINWDDGTTEEWIGPYPSGEPIAVEHTWSEPKTYRIAVQAKDQYDTRSDRVYHSLEVTNSQPSNPTIEGPPLGKARQDIDFEITTADPEGHEFFFFIDWGDGHTSGWIGPYDSNEPTTFNHTYEGLGRYTIQVTSKDIYDAQSGWTDLKITILPSLAYPNAKMSFMQKIYDFYRDVCNRLYG